MSEKMLKNKLDLTLLRYIMLGINITACLFIAILFYATSNLACEKTDADVFLSSLNRVPKNPRTLLIFTALFSALFFATFAVRQISVRHTRTVTAISLYADAVLTILLLVVLRFNYNGFILYLLANIIYYIKSSRKFTVIAFGSFLYMICSYDVISVYFPLFSVKDYFLFYDRAVQHRLFFIFYVLCNLNFVFYYFFGGNFAAAKKHD